MIDDSVPWKIELLKIADRLEKRKTQRRWTERTSFLVERDMMIAAYAIRKLFEAAKLSDRLSARQIQVHRHALLDKPPSYFSVHRFWDHYDFDSCEHSSLSLRQLCNQIIHSFNWVITTEENTNALAGILVSSKDHRKYIYFLDIEEIIAALRDVGYDDVVEICWHIDQDGHEQTSLLGADIRTAYYEWLMTGHRPQD
jgi:hypothetical protein